MFVYTIVDYDGPHFAGTSKKAAITALGQCPAHYIHIWTDGRICGEITWDGRKRKYITTYDQWYLDQKKSRSK